jgi:hypothetical protein
VEQQTVAVGSDDRILVAGNPVFVWAEKTSGYELLALDSLIGIVIDSGSTKVHGVPNPLPGRTLAGMRAIALRAGWWLVTFAEVDSIHVRRSPKVLAMWAGETDGAHWRSLERLPAVTDTLESANMSRLDLRDGRVQLAVLANQGRGRRVVLYSRDAGRWTAVRNFFGSADYVDLTSTERYDLLAVVRADTLERRDHNSLFLYAKGRADTAWTLRYRVWRGFVTPAHEPQFLPDDEAPSLVWYTIDAPGGEEGWVVAAGAERDDAPPARHFASQVRQFQSSARDGVAVVSTTDRATPRTVQLFEIHGSDRIARVSRRETRSPGLTSVGLTRDRAVVIESKAASAPGDPAVISRLESHAWRCQQRPQSRPAR